MNVLAIGRIVLYTLTAIDAEAINKRRNDAMINLHIHRANANGVVIHYGNAAKTGDVLPMVIIRINAPGLPFESVNGKVFLDGNDDFWVTSIHEGNVEGTYAFPVRDEAKVSFEVKEGGGVGGLNPIVGSIAETVRTEVKRKVKKRVPTERG